MIKLIFGVIFMDDHDDFDPILRYDKMVEKALRSVVRHALDHVIKDGLPGDHHFYITFMTQFPGVELPPYLKEQYPDEMTIVLQYQFYGLEVDEERMVVTLSFNNVPERLVIPLEAVTIFADPSVNFALQFQPIDEYDYDDEFDEFAEQFSKFEEEALKETSKKKDDKKTGDDDDDKGGKVISLDSFRKK